MAKSTKRVSKSKAVKSKEQSPSKKTAKKQASEKKSIKKLSKTKKIKSNLQSKSPVAKKKASKKAKPLSKSGTLKKSRSLSKSAKKSSTKKTTAKKPTTKKKTKTAVSKKSVTAVSSSNKKTSLVEKLGVKADSILTLLGGPIDFLKTLGPLPANVRIHKTALGDRDVTVWFPRNATELKRRIDTIAASVNGGSLWIAWPKQSSDVETDLTRDMIRKLSLAEGIVDIKVCSIDETYSGLKFTSRKK